MSRWRRHASHLLRVQRPLYRGSEGAIMWWTAITKFTIGPYYKPGRPDVGVFWYLRSGPRLGPARSLRTAVNIPRGVIREGAFNPLRRFRFRTHGGRSLLLPHLRWGVVFFLLFVVIVGERRRSFVFGRHVRSAFSARVLLGPFGRFPGRLLWHLIRCGKKHFRQ